MPSRCISSNLGAGIFASTRQANLTNATRLASLPWSRWSNRETVRLPPIWAAGRHHNWTGFHVELNGAGAFGRSGFVGGTVGFNYPKGPLMFGLEGDMDGSSGSGACVAGTLSCQSTNDWLDTARGRIRQGVRSGPALRDRRRRVRQSQGRRAGVRPWRHHADRLDRRCAISAVGRENRLTRRDVASREDRAQKHALDHDEAPTQRPSIRRLPGCCVSDCIFGSLK